MSWDLGKSLKNLHKAMPGVGSSDPKKALKNLHNAMPGSDQLNPQITADEATKPGSASDQMGKLMRAEWDDYITRFAPYDQKLIGLATSDEDNQQAIDRARAGVSSAFDTATGTLQRNNERLGVSGLADVNQSMSRQIANNRTLAELNVANKTRLHAQDRDKSIMAGDAAAGLKSGRLTGAS